MRKLRTENCTANYPSSPKVLVKDGNIAADGKYYDTIEEYQSHVMSVTGITDPELALFILYSLIRSQGVVSEETETTMNNAIRLLAEFRPRNIEETISVSHIVVLNRQACKLYIKANEMFINSEVQREYLKTAIQISHKIFTVIEKLQKYRRNSSYQLYFEFIENYSSTYLKIKNVRQKKIKGQSALNAPEVHQEKNKLAALRFKDMPIPEQIPLFE
jgi:hypothetical protein